MSTQPAAHLSGVMLPGRAPGRLSNAMSVAGLSFNGGVLFVMSLLIVASGFLALRPAIFGMRVHPYIAVVAAAFPFVVMSRIHLFPRRVLVSMLIFTAMYFFSVINGSSIAVNEVFKTGTAIVTVVTCALLVRRRGDIVAAALGMNIAVALLAVRGLQEDIHTGLEAMQGANKNSYSLYALPALLMAGFIILRMKTVPMIVKATLFACTIPALAVIFMGGNRSGYLGAVLIGLMLFWDRRGKGLLLVVIIGGIVALGIQKFGTTEVLDERMRQTVQGTKSDDMRKEILFACMAIALENPLVGVSPQLVSFEIGRRLPVVFRSSVIDSHNVFAHVMAASGLICFAALLAVGWTLWNWKPRLGGKVGGADDPLREARKLMRMMIILWVIRGMFTREILYNPCFCIALGLIIGMCMLAEVARSRQGTGGSDFSNPLLPASHGAFPRPVV